MRRSRSLLVAISYGLEIEQRAKSRLDSRQRLRGNLAEAPAEALDGQRADVLRLDEARSAKASLGRSDLVVETNPLPLRGHRKHDREPGGAVIELVHGDDERRALTRLPPPVSGAEVGLPDLTS